MLNKPLALASTPILFRSFRTLERKPQTWSQKYLPSSKSAPFVETHWVLTAMLNMILLLLETQ